MIALDRAGIVGEDGKRTRIYDLTLLLPLPGLKFSARPYEDLETAPVMPSRPAARRDPLSRRCPGRAARSPRPFNRRNRRTADTVCWSATAALPASGSQLRWWRSALAGPAWKRRQVAGEASTPKSCQYFVSKPFDWILWAGTAQRTGHGLMLEESCVKAAWGKRSPDLLRLCPGTICRLLGIEDRPLCQGKREELIRDKKLDSEGIAAAARALLNGCSRSGSAL